MLINLIETLIRILAWLSKKYWGVGEPLCYICKHPAKGKHSEFCSKRGYSPENDFPQWKWNLLDNIRKFA